MEVSNMFLFNWVIFRLHIKFQGCRHYEYFGAYDMGYDKNMEQNDLWSSQPDILVSLVLQKIQKNFGQSLASLLTDQLVKTTMDSVCHEKWRNKNATVWKRLGQTIMDNPWRFLLGWFVEIRGVPIVSQLTLFKGYIIYW